MVARVHRMNEQKLLWISIIVTAVFSLVGIIWGLAIDSGIILFDGLYSLLSLSLSFLSLLTLKQISKGESRRFPFGRAQFEPMLVAFKSMMIMGMCIYAALDAVSALFQGGRAVEIGAALIYATLSTIGCLVMTILLARYSKKLGSSLLQAEKNQWLGDFFLSACVLIAFVVAGTVLKNHYPDLIPYIDPFMVVVASSLFLALPGASLWGAMKELLYVQAPTEALTFLLPKPKKSPATYRPTIKSMSLLLAGN